MTAVHRPLSAWISYLDGSALEPVNDGDDRSDARSFTCFDEGWARTSAPWGQSHALALSDGTSIVVELDNFGRPIPVTPAIAAAVERVEQNWPHFQTDARDFAEASFSLRYWLLQRLAEEGAPSDEAFSVLPWELLDRAVASLLITLDNPGELGELVEMRHWLTPAVCGLTGPLEQLDHGLRTNDERVARLGAAGLLNNLRHLPLSRIPTASLGHLTALVQRLGTADPWLQHAARVVRARILGESVSLMNVRLSSTLLAAANDKTVREHSESVADGNFRLHVDETQAGWVRVVVEISWSDVEPLWRRDGMFAPIRVVPADDSPEQHYWIALYPENDAFVGAIAFQLPPGLSEIDGDGVPVGVDELAAETTEALLPSLFASIPQSARQWMKRATMLPSRHPVKAAVLRFEESL